MPDFADSFESELDDLLNHAGEQHYPKAVQISQRIAAFYEQALRSTDDDFRQRMSVAIGMEVLRLEILVAHAALDVRQRVEAAAQKAAGMLIAGLIGV